MFEATGNDRDIVTEFSNHPKTWPSHGEHHTHEKPILSIADCSKIFSRQGCPVVSLEEAEI
jgi:hypothetical protein